MVRHAVILAGGAGTRLWPASTKKHPKQFLEVAGERSLFAMTLQRAISLGIEGRICIVTHRDHADAIVAASAEVLAERDYPAERLLVLAEPEGKNTAPAIAFACHMLHKRSSAEDSLLVMPADHIIDPVPTFVEDVEKASILAGRDLLVTFGIPPLGPETGYGYVEAGKRLDPGFRVRSFKEKPDEATARSFLAQGNHYWNSGMFAFRAGVFLAELGRHAPEVDRAFSGLRPKSVGHAPTGRAPELLPPNEALRAAYAGCPSISIDYAVMERSDRSAMVSARFSWSDVGSWDVVAQMGSSSAEGSENVIAVNAQDNFVLADLPVALVGVEDLIVVVKNGVVLVCKRGGSQAVRDVVQMLEHTGREDLL